METGTRNIGSLVTVFSLCAVSFVLPAQAQSFCDSVFIEHVQYNAVYAQQIEVSAMTTSQNNCFGYPTFVLYDQNGDTLAQESFGFFCLGLGNFQTHQMNVLPGATIPQGQFPGTLELFSGFGDTLVCSWQIIFDLCPPDSCVQAEIYLTDMHAQLGQGPVYWQAYDSAGTQSFSGTIQMDGINNTHFDTLCLPPGVFDLSLSPFSSINVFDSIVLGITTSYQQSIGINTSWPIDSTPWDLSFRWYEECIDFTNAVQEFEEASFQAFQEGSSLVIIAEERSPLRQLALFSLQGQLLHVTNANAQRTEISIGTLTKGLYIVRVLANNGAHTAQKVVIQ